VRALASGVVRERDMGLGWTYTSLRWAHHCVPGLERSSFVGCVLAGDSLGFWTKGKYLTTEVIERSLRGTHRQENGYGIREQKGRH